ncbi:hypothetical protein D3C75_1341410 [compost metagenome]
MKCAVDKLALSGRDRQIAVDGPVFQGIGIFAHRPFAGAGGVKQDRIKSFRQCSTKNATIKMG